MQYVTANENDAPLTEQEFRQQMLAKQRQSARYSSIWAIGFGVSVFAIYGFLIFSETLRVSDVFQSIFFVFGIIALLGGIFGLYQAAKLTLEDIIPTPQAERLALAFQRTIPIFTYLLLGCLALVMLVQTSAKINNSIASAGLVKVLVRQGEWWRLLTCAFLHANFLHLLMNGLALFNIGKTIEVISNRVHLATVFIVSAVTGSLFSLWLMPEGVSVGASGGIMGLLGFLAIFGYRRKRDLPPDFLRNIITNLLFIGVIGVVGFAVIDNAAHFGGLIGGVIYGVLVIPANREKSPQQTGLIPRVLGFASIALIILTTIFTVTKILSHTSAGYLLFAK